MTNSTTLAPVETKQRISIIDILRGWALLGIILMNFSDFFYDQINPETYIPSTSDTIILYFFHYLFSTKCWTLLAILFGYGFSIFYKKNQDKVNNISLFFIKRMLLLLVIGLLNSLIYSGDILIDYAIIGIIMVPFIRLKAKSLFLISVAILLITPILPNLLKIWYPLPKFDYEYYHLLSKSSSLIDIFKGNLYMRYNTFLLSYFYAIMVHLIQLAGFLLGIAAAKANFFNTLDYNFKKKIKKIFWFSLITGIFIFIIYLLGNKYPFSKIYDSRYPLAIPIMLFTSASVCWLYISKKLKSFFSALEIIGKMTLTSYLTQNIVAFILFTIFKVPLPLYGFYLFAIFFFILQVFFSKWWLSKYNYGPIEWIWRSLSYGKWFILEKKD